MIDEMTDDFTELPEGSFLASNLVEAIVGRSKSDSEKPKLPAEINYTQFSCMGPNGYQACSNTEPDLPAGAYVIENTRQGIVFFKKDLKVDDLIEFEDAASDTVMKEIISFWGRNSLFKKYGFLHRRGYMMYGPPGSGKTCIIQQVMAKVIASGGVVFINSGHPQMFSEGLKIYRQVSKQRPVVCVFEDIDATIQKYGDDELLSLLDGENQIDVVLNLASTNYPERLDKRIVARPRRFDRVVKIGMPPENVRRKYFKSKLKVTDLSDEELDKWVAETAEFSFASMAELVISVLCLGNDFDASIETLRKMSQRNPSSDEFKGGLGFGR